MLWKNQMKLERRLICTVICLSAAAVMAGCSGEKGGQPAASTTTPAAPPPKGMVILGPSAPELKQMEIQVVQERGVPVDEVIAPARIEVNPNRLGHAVLPAPGRIVHVLVKLGDAVTRGQPVVTLDSPAVSEAESGYLQAESSVRQAELTLSKAEADLARLSDLLEHNAVAQKEVMSARTAAALARTSVDSAQTALEQARRRLELLGLKPGLKHQQITITAPVSGKVLNVGVVDGEFRNEINTPLLTIADLSRVWATSEVPESKIRYCRAGGTADLELIAYPKEKFRARVTRVADTVDSETRTIKVSAELDNPNGRLLPEMFGTIRYDSGSAPAPWVPESAVFRLNESDYVFLELSPGHFQSVQVELGKRHDGGFAVIQGLKSSDRIVTQGSVYLKSAL